MKLKSPMFNEKVVITQLNNKFAIDLTNDNILTNSGVLKHGLTYKILQAIKLIPPSTKLVLYHTEKRQAIGFLCLEENTDWLYSIKYVFVDPNYRKMGLATRLLNYAMILAKEKGAKKVNLNVYSTDIKTINLYKKLGFKKYGTTLLGQGSIPEFALFRLIKQATVGVSNLSKLTSINQGKLFNLKMNARKNREIIYSIYQLCLDKKWIDFFEINANNLQNGSRHVWRPIFFKDVVINNSANAFALIFNNPFLQKANVEVYSISDYLSLSILEHLLEILKNRGISFTQITLFNIGNSVTLNWFQKKGMRTFEFTSMGKTL